ncbi:MAG: DUF3488 domain-containing transglutaminase family protein [Gammaproteobacteria bacterium]|nr:DUF3488 domain-containing transglutaminase family protein [Gammaproteobacteria bacterium]
MLESLTRPGLLPLLLFSQLIVSAPHLWRLPAWLSGLSLAALLWRYLAERRRLPMAGPWLGGLLALLALGGVFYEFRTIAGREAGVALLVLMSCLKVLELRKRRDAVLLVNLGYFLIGTNFLFSQTMAMATYMLAALWVNTLSQIALNRLDACAQPRELARSAGRLVLLSLPYVLVLFVLFPRLPGPLWRMPDSGGRAVTGMSDTMTPGDVSALSQNDNIAFRVRFEGENPPRGELYWRGLVLAAYDGLTWSAGYTPLRGVPKTELDGGETRHYRIALEPGRYRWLYALDVPAEAAPGTRLRGDYQLLLERPLNDRLNYPMSSLKGYRIGLELTDVARLRFLALPKGDGNSRARIWAQAEFAAAGSPEGFVQRVLRHVHDSPFYYTLNPPILGEAQIDDFWFNQRRGFCEHYAGSFVYLMRAAGVPARVVVGYQGGEANPYGNYLIVRQSDAHAWTEVWLEGQGWKRIDPTSAIAASRVESRLERRFSGLDPLFDPASFGEAAVPDAWADLALYWDSLNSRWNTWVVSFDAERQAEALSNLGLPNWSGAELGYVLAVLLALVLAVGGVLLLREQRALDTIARTFLHLERRLARRGFVRETHEPPAEFLARVARARPAQAEALVAIARLYTTLRYRNSSKPLLLQRELRRQVARLSI